jgi:integrase
MATAPQLGISSRVKGDGIDGQKGFSMARRRYQNGTSRKRGKNWLGSWREDVMQLDGTIKRIERSIVVGSLKTYPTKRLAIRALNMHLLRVNSPAYRPGKVATLSEFAEIWKVQVLVNRKPSTIRCTDSHLRHHIIPQLGTMGLEQIGKENQQRFVTHLRDKVSRKMLLNILGTLSSMLTTAKKWDYVTEVVDRSLLEIPTRQVQAPVRFFTADEARKIIAAAISPWREMYAISAMTGMRCGEVLGLSVEDLDFTKRQISVRRSVWRGKIQTPKSSHSVAVLPMPNALAVMLEAYLTKWEPNRERLLFAGRFGNPFTGEKVVRYRLQPLLDQLGLPRAGFHAFRHAHASLLLESGASPTVAQAQLRHSDPRITLGIYAHLVGDEQRQAVENVSRMLVN